VNDESGMYLCRIAGAGRQAITRRYECISHEISAQSIFFASIFLADAKALKQMQAKAFPVE